MENARLKINDKEVGLRKVGEGLYEPKNLEVLTSIVNGIPIDFTAESYFHLNPFKPEAKDFHKIKSFCLVSTKEVKEEADVLIMSIRVFHDQPIYVVCDDESHIFLRAKGHKDVFFKATAGQDQLGMIREKYFKTLHTKINDFHRSDVIIKKMETMNFALGYHDNTFFLDADIVVLEPLQENFECDVAFSPHHYGPSNLHHAFEFGFFNAGYVFCSERAFPNYWKYVYLNDSIFFEQECMDRIPEQYETQTFDDSHNVGFWRDGKLDQNVRHKSLHTHLYLTDSIENRSIRVKNEIHRAACLEYIRKTNSKIYNYINKVWAVKNHKTAFVHFGKCAGVFTQMYIKLNVLLGNSTIYNSWWEGGEPKKRKLMRDWTREELIEIASTGVGPAFAHNHHINWEKESLAAFRENGWFTFTFVRDPRDLICSLYFWAVDRSEKYDEQEDGNALTSPLEGEILSMSGQKDITKVSLDDFFKFFVTAERAGAKGLWVLPDYINHIDYVAEFNDENFADFLRVNFNHEFKSSGYRDDFEGCNFNKSPNKGYAFYYKNGDISEESHQLMLNDVDYKRHVEFLSRKENKQAPAPDMLEWLDKHSIEYRRAFRKKVGIAFFKDNPHLK